MRDSEEQPYDLRKVRTLWEDLIKAWTTLSGAYEVLDRAIRVKRTAREEVARAYEGLMQAKEKEPRVSKTVRRFAGLHLARETRIASRRLDRAIADLEAAERFRAAAEQAQARALEACQQAKAIWDKEYGAYTRDEKARLILGVPASASPDEIKKAYRDAARACHPDRAKTNEMSTQLATELFYQLNDAFEALSEK
jgi:DnaJ-domain-containing protein 1